MLTCVCNMGGDTAINQGHTGHRHGSLGNEYYTRSSFASPLRITGQGDQSVYLRPVWCGTGQAVRHAKLQAAMEGLMAFLIQTISIKKDHIPPVVSTSTVTFPFDISIAGYCPDPFLPSLWPERISLRLVWLCTAGHTWHLVLPEIKLWV